MERTLVMIRHAKSSWANPLQSDFDRPLNSRGKEDAPCMGEKLKKAHLVPDLIIASSARRTRQTAKRIAKAVGYDEDKIKLEEKLYHCIPAVLEEVIYEMPDYVKTVFIVAHNPGITEFVNQLTHDFCIANMPTCGVVAAKVETAGEGWASFPLAKKKILLFEHPKNDDSK